MIQFSDKKDSNPVEKASSFQSVTTNFVSVNGDSRIRLTGSTNSLNKGTSSPLNKQFSSPNKKTAPSATTKGKSNVEYKKTKKPQSPLQKKLQDPNSTWHDILAPNMSPLQKKQQDPNSTWHDKLEWNKSIADEPSFNTKYGIDENDKNVRIKEYKPKLPSTPRYPRRPSKADEVGDGSEGSLKKDVSLEKGDSKRRSSTTEKYEIKETNRKHTSRPRTSSRDPLMPLPHRSPPNKFSISKKKKGADGGLDLETVSNISGLLSNGESHSLKDFPKSTSGISSFREAGK